MINGSVGNDSVSSIRPSRIRVLVSRTPRAISERGIEDIVDVPAKGVGIDERQRGPSTAKPSRGAAGRRQGDELGDRLAGTRDRQPLATLSALDYLAPVVPQIADRDVCHTAPSRASGDLAAAGPQPSVDPFGPAGRAVGWSGVGGPAGQNPWSGGVWW